MENPYGTQITAADVVETLGFFDNWEDRYRYIIDLGKELPAMSEAQKREELLVRGCQSQVWLKSSFDGERLHFRAASDAIITSGLIALLLEIYTDKGLGTLVSR